MSSGARRLRDAASAGKLDRLRWLLNRGHHPDAANGRGTTPLHCAVICGHTEVVQELLRAEADPNARRACRALSSPLACAVDKYWLRGDIIQLLAEAGANPDGLIEIPPRPNAPQVKLKPGKWRYGGYMSSDERFFLQGLRAWYATQIQTWTVRVHHEFPRRAQEWVVTVMLCAARIATPAPIDDEDDSMVLECVDCAPSLSPSNGLPPMPFEMWAEVLSLICLKDMLPERPLDPHWYDWILAPEAEIKASSW